MNNGGKLSKAPGSTPGILHSFSYVGKILPPSPMVPPGTLETIRAGRLFYGLRLDGSC